jgi:hypothetical protein
MPTTAATDSPGSNRADVIAGLRALADSQHGVMYRDLLFRAALMLDRDHTLVFVERKPHPEQERHGDQTT